MDDYNEKTEITVIKNSSFTKIGKINDILLNIKQFINSCLSGLSLPTNQENLKKKVYEKQKEIWTIEYQQVLETIENIRIQDISNKTKDQQLIENKIFIKTFPAFWYIGKLKTGLITTKLNRINLALKDINIDYFIFNIEVTRFTCRLFQEIFDCLELINNDIDRKKYKYEITTTYLYFLEILENLIGQFEIYLINKLLYEDNKYISDFKYLHKKINKIINKIDVLLVKIIND